MAPQLEAADRQTKRLRRTVGDAERWTKTVSEAAAEARLQSTECRARAVELDRRFQKLREQHTQTVAGYERLDAVRKQTEAAGTDCMNQGFELSKLITEAAARHAQVESMARATADRVHDDLRRLAVQQETLIAASQKAGEIKEQLFTAAQDGDDVYRRLCDASRLQAERAAQGHERLAEAQRKAEGTAGLLKEACGTADGRLGALEQANTDAEQYVERLSKSAGAATDLTKRLRAQAQQLRYLAAKASSSARDCHESRNALIRERTLVTESVDRLESTRVEVEDRCHTWEERADLLDRQLRQTADRSAQVLGFLRKSVGQVRRRAIDAPLDTGHIRNTSALLRGLFADLSALREGSVNTDGVGTTKASSSVFDDDDRNISKVGWALPAF